MISVIIINKNDTRINNTLNHLGTIIRPDKTEIIVVDASLGKLNDIQKRYLNVKWIDFTPKNKTTIPEQRNLGVRTAKGKIIVFIDADCIPDKNWLVELIKPIIEENEYICAGRVIVSGIKSLHNIESDKIKDNKYIGEAPTMNLAIKKELFDRLGVFNEKLLYGSDVDFCWRAIGFGYKIRYCTNAVITHDLGNVNKEIRRMFSYGRARVRLYRIHMDRIKIFFRYEFPVVLYPLYIFCFPIFIYYPFFILLLLPFIFKYRKNNPISLYFMKFNYGLGMLIELFFPFIP